MTTVDDLFQNTYLNGPNRERLSELAPGKGSAGRPDLERLSGCAQPGKAQQASPTGKGSAGGTGMDALGIFFCRRRPRPLLFRQVLETVVLLVVHDKLTFGDIFWKISFFNHEFSPKAVPPVC